MKVVDKIKQEIFQKKNTEKMQGTSQNLEYMCRFHSNTLGTELYKELTNSLLANQDRNLDFFGFEDVENQTKVHIENSHEIFRKIEKGVGLCHSSAGSPLKIKIVGDSLSAFLFSQGMYSGNDLLSHG